MSIETTATRLIQNNTRNNDKGDTLLLSRARTMDSKIVRTRWTYRGHFLAIVAGSNGEQYESWFYNSGKVYCTCAFAQGLDPRDRQSVGCKHLLTAALRLNK